MRLVVVFLTTLAALVLGLLVASAKANHAGRDGELHLPLFEVSVSGLSKSVSANGEKWWKAAVRLLIAQRLLCGASCNHPELYDDHHHHRL